MTAVLVLALLGGGGELPGWMGFAAARSAASPTFGWSPVHREADAVVFSAAFRPQWDAVARGTAYRGITAEGAVVLRYLGTREERYGCEANTAAMTAFRAERRLPEGPVWVLPADAPLKPAPVPVVAAPSGKESRAWTAGRLEIAVRKTGERTALLRVSDQGRPILEEALEKHYMEGADLAPVDLSGTSEIGMPFPLAAFALSPGGPWLIVFRQPGYEGNAFRSLLVEDGRASFLESERHSPFLYLCAF